MNRKERRAAAKSGRAGGTASVDIVALLHDGLRRQEAGRFDEAAARYREALEHAPDNPDALHLLGVIAHLKGDHGAAIDLIGRALRGAPDVAMYHNNMGAALRAAGRHAEAAEHYRRAVALEPGDIGARVNLGNALDALGEAAAAAEAYRAALARDPGCADAHSALAGVLARTGDAAGALRHCERALALDPRSAIAHHNLATALATEGRGEAAATAFRRALELDPDYAAAWIGLGAVLREAKRPEEAEQALRRGLALNARDAYGWTTLGLALEDLGRLDDATEAMRRATAADADYGPGWASLGVLLRVRGRPAEAEPALREAIRINPASAHAWEMLGLALGDLGRFDEAVDAHRRSVSLAPASASAHNNFGLTLRLMGRFEEALAEYDRALAGDPGHTSAASNRALLLLAMGRFADGWRDYRRRHSVDPMRPRLVQDALPNDLAGRRILVLRDQGLGDEIFFLRFLPRLKMRGAWIAYRSQPQLAGMIARLPIIDRVIDESRDPEPADVDITLSAGDLPWLTGMRSAADLPDSIALAPLVERIAAMRDRLAAAGPPPWIGITWRAGIQEFNRLSKITPQDALAEALRGAHGTLVALQRGPAPGEMARFAAIAGRPLADFTALNNDLESMLALLGLIDEYVCVSNTNVHLRAARGRTSRVLVPFPADYRWMNDGAESPWFPGCAVYRESRDGGWQAAFARLAADLAAAWPVTRGQDAGAGSAPDGRVNRS